MYCFRLVSLEDIVYVVYIYFGGFVVLLVSYDGLVAWLVFDSEMSPDYGLSSAF